MTYSYLLRAWAMEHIDKGILGRDAIAAVCGVPPRTVGSWIRAETGRGAYLITTHREYERALGILLYDNFPNHRFQAAEIVQASTRMIQEWRTQLHSPRYNNEFAGATRLAVVVMSPKIKRYFKITDGQITQSKGKLPDSLDLEEIVWQVYDDILLKMLQQTHLVRYRKKTSGSNQLDAMLKVGEYASPLPLSPIPTLQRLNGPHRYRGATLHDNGHIDYDGYVEKQREAFNALKTEPGYISQYEKLTIAKGDLHQTLNSLRLPQIQRKKYKLRYGREILNWNQRDALLAYMLNKHHQFNRTKSTNSLAK